MACKLIFNHGETNTATKVKHQNCGNIIKITGMSPLQKVAAGIEV